MKKLLLVLLAFGITMGLFAQTRPHFPKGLIKGQQAIPVVTQNDNIVGSQSANPVVAPKSALSDFSTMETTYDEQTNGSVCPRCYRYDNGTIAGLCTWSKTAGFADRGTGYNFYTPGANGSGWGAQPSSRIETSMRTGWPSYAPLGAGGEMFVSHNVAANQPLIFGTRATRGTGAWTVNTSLTALGPPSGATVMAWPRVVTNGYGTPPRMNIHIIAITEPVANGGVTYQGLDGALLYIKSTDGGATWTSWQQLPGMTSSLYSGFGGDVYNWAEPHGDTIAFTVSCTVGRYGDQFIMKSVDNGANWTKTIVWHGLYNLWTGGTATDTFYSPDGSCAAAIDMNGNVHVAFGRLRMLGDNTGTHSYFHMTDGVVYWHEGMAQLPQSLDVDSIFLGYVHDTNVYYQDPATIALYQLGLSTFPQIVTDNSNNVFVTWSSVTMLKDATNPGTPFLLRHIYARASINGGFTWRDSIPDLNKDFFSYHFTECVYGSASPTSNDSLYILFQGDQYAGTYVFDGVNSLPGQTAIDSNYLYMIKPSKADIIMKGIGINEKKNQPSMVVYQNTPNPFNNQTQVKVLVSKPGTLSMEVYSLVGQKVMEINKGAVNSGDYRFTLSSSQFSPGVYFYTVKFNNESATRKMIVE